MTPSTRATLDRLENAEWFARTGQMDSETDVVVLLSSWDEAMMYSSSIDWQNLKLEMANRVRERLLAKAPERFEQWNDVVRELKPVTMRLVRERTAPVIKEFGLPSDFRSAVDWDILHLCMEAEYADVVPPGFYAGQAYWYAVGHFPCGWQEDGGRGKPIIY